MASTTIFNKRDGSISSIRTTTGSGSSKISISHYMGSTRCGATFKSNGVSARFNNKGQSMGTSMKTGKSTSYYNSVGSPISKMTQF